MTARAAFKQDDVRRAVRGVEAAGLRVSRVLFSPEGIEVVIADADGKPRRKQSLADKLYGPQA